MAASKCEEIGHVDVVSFVLPLRSCSDDGWMVTVLMNAPSRSKLGVWMLAIMITLSSTLILGALCAWMLTPYVTRRSSLFSSSVLTECTRERRG